MLSVPLVGCEWLDTPPAASVSRNAVFVGGVVADEPRAALAAHDVFAAGGSAADAAVNLAFTLAVTYPAAASLGGGGQCLVYVRSDEADSVEVLDFPPVRSTTSAGSGQQASAVPGLVRGLAALHARHGTLRWSRLLRDAEVLARFGYPVSRALAWELARTDREGRLGTPLRTLFAGEGGTVAVEGDTIVQPELGDLLSALRAGGGGDFYVGRTARELVSAVAEAGGTLSADDLRRYRPHWRETVSLPVGEHELHTSPGSAGVAGIVVRSLAAAEGRYASTQGVARIRLLSEALARGGAESAVAGTALDPDYFTQAMAGFRLDGAAVSHISRPEGLSAAPPATSFTVADRRGMVVTCGLTLNAPFGNGRVAPGTGMLLAAPPSSMAEDTFFFAPAILVNRRSKQFFLAAGAGGSEGAGEATSALATTLLALIDEERPLRDALLAPRLHYDAMADGFAGEPAILEAHGPMLEERNLQLSTMSAIGRVAAIHCPGGLPRSPATCRMGNDPRGFGLAVGGIR